MPIADRSTPRRTRRRTAHGKHALAAFATLAAADLAAVTRRPRGPLRAAKPLLMPALAAYTLRRRGPGAEGPPSTALMAGLAFATAGDIALLFDAHEPALLLGMAAFLGTQVSYTAGCARRGALAALRRDPRPAVGALAVWAAATAALAPTLERRLRLPVAGYGLVLAATAATAAAVGGTVAVGAGAFLASDLLIGLQAAGHTFPAQEVLIMAGYLLGQFLIATGWPAPPA
ncbi:lysoplasmalogenase family protein [Streptomyces sp. URMC 123]|uniref:lysoplasmalogenase family protein n=1 Tax=Streptomyces sp. URMC 123 TaxID=3423403 RepID=UPI003F1CDE4E